MDCNTCKERETHGSVPRWTHEADMARMERSNRRLWIALLLTIVLLVASNAAWVWYENQFVDEVTETYTSEATDNGTAIVNRDGEVHYGESDLHEDN